MFAPSATLSIVLTCVGVKSIGAPADIAPLIVLAAIFANFALVTAAALILSVVTALLEIVVAPSPFDVTSPVWFG